MRTLEQQLAQYAAYHRDRRNIATHFVGIPMIVLATCIFLSRPAFSLFGVSASLAVFITAAAGIYYLILDLRLGIAMCAALALCLAAAHWLAAESTVVWLASGIALFLIGWAIQLVGHQHYEGRKPAFLDDIVGLLIGPLFVMAELVFALGLRAQVRHTIELQAGPVHSHGADDLGAANHSRSV